MEDLKYLTEAFQDLNILNEDLQSLISWDCIELSLYK